MGVGLGLAVYNFARFENILEFGLTYQLANIDYTNFQNVFSPSRVRQNLYVYFLYPVRLLSRFPFIHRMEYLNSNDRMAGLLFVAPFFILALPLFWLKKYCGGEVCIRHLHQGLPPGIGFMYCLPDPAPYHLSSCPIISWQWGSSRISFPPFWPMLCFRLAGGTMSAMERPFFEPVCSLSSCSRG